MTITLNPWSWAVIGALTVGVAAAVSAILIARLRPLLVRYALAKPNARSSHREPTPQGGGIAVVAATISIAAVVALSVAGITTSFRSDLGAVITAALAIAMVGVADDIRAIKIGPRLLLQAIAVGIVIFAVPANLSVLPFLPWWLERALLVLGGLWFVNLVNFMDGLDWMSVAEVVPVAGGLVLLGALGALPAYAVVMALALFGAMLGFAPFNRPVARVFLGDVGSLPIGLLLGWLLLLLAGRGHLVAALLLPLYYLADATVTLLRRLISGELFWTAHRKHFYQQATDRGFTVIAIVGRVFAINLVLVGLATIAVWFDTFSVCLAALLLGLLLVGLLLVTFARGRP